MGIAYNTSVVRSGLVLHLDAANVKSYPGSGTVWKDLSGKNNTSSVSGTTSYNTDNKGAIKFVSGAELLTTTDNATLSSTFATGSFTILTTVRSDDVVYPRSRHPLYVNLNPTTSTERGLSAGHTSTSSQIELRISDGTTLVNGFIAHAVQESTIYNRAFVVDRTAGANIKYYVNSQYLGQVDAPTVTGSIYTNGGLVFGTVWGWRYIGNIYSVMVYNRSLSASEIKQNFEATRGRYGI